MRESAQKYAKCFSGLTDAYSVLFYKGNTPNEKGKRESYNIVYSKDESGSFVDKQGNIKPSIEQALESHLDGTGPSIGVFPTTRDNTCSFGCIDIDEYTDLNHQQILDKIKELNLPIVLFRSKSGGVHAYLFSSPAVSAASMQTTLKNISSLLGFSTSEIFPKQAELLANDVGNGINAPYEDCNSEPSRYAYKPNGKAATLEEFFALYDSKVQTPDQIVALGSLQPKELDIFKEGPPCLVILTEDGKKISKGNRNNALFSIGVYLRKRFPESWDMEIYDYNKKCIDPPLNRAEIEALIKSLNVKTYGYKCGDQPICNFCNKSLCLTRKFGVGGIATCTITSLRKYDSEPPLWVVDVDSKGLELQTDQLLEQPKFQKAALEQLNLLPPSMARKDWEANIADLLSEMVEYHAITAVSEEVSISGQFKEYLISFLQSQLSEVKEEILLRRPYYDEEKQQYTFRLMDLDAYLKRNKFSHYKTRTDISARLRELGAESITIRLKNKASVRAWRIDELDPDESVALDAASFEEEDVPF